jgi:hypothetical protein
VIQRATVVRVSDCFEIWEDERTQYRSLHASEHLTSSQQVCSFTPESVMSDPKRFSVQVDEFHHIMLHPEYLSYINHSCDPNVYLDTTDMQVIALREIYPAEEITFFYPSTEWTMAQPFQCLCNSARCLKYIRGAAFLSLDVISSYRLSAHVQRLLIQDLPQEVLSCACHSQNILLRRWRAAWLTATVPAG